MRKWLAQIGIYSAENGWTVEVWLPREKGWKAVLKSMFSVPRPNVYIATNIGELHRILTEEILKP